MLTIETPQNGDEFSASNLPESEAASLVIAIAWSGTIVALGTFWLAAGYSLL